jgi:hypothetical protein
LPKAALCATAWTLNDYFVDSDQAKSSAAENFKEAADAMDFFKCVLKHGNKLCLV